MLKLSKKTGELTVEFCERCGEVCGSTCRRDAGVERARERALLYGARFL